MSDYQYEVGGASVVYTNAPPPPYNPLHRPEIHYKKPILALIIYLAGLLLWGLVGGLCLKGWLLLLTAGWSVLYFAVIGKRAVIWCVHLYQNKASDRTRLKCVFEPSCSEYMILAIQKYGLIRGVWKGIRRLLRCHPPGGVDYP